MENYDENSGPLISLSVDRLNDGTGTGASAKNILASVQFNIVLRKREW